MTDHSDTQNVYLGANCTFHEILHEGRLGGADGLHHYLGSRLNQLNRKLSTHAKTDAEKGRVLVGITAMKDAMILISMMTSKTV